MAAEWRYNFAMSRLILFPLTLSLLLLLAACTSVDPTPTPTAVTAALRVTAVHPTRTVQPLPTATATPTLSSTSTPSATATIDDMESFRDTNNYTPPPTLRPTFTPTPVASLAPIVPTIAIWTAIGTPMPQPQAIISPENVVMLQEFGRWGKGVVTEAIYSPDGKQLAVSTPLGVYFYDSETAQQLHFIQARRELAAFAISSDWQFIALGYAWPGGIDVLSLSNNTLLQTFETGNKAVSSLAFSPDNKMLFSRIWYTGIVGWRVSDGTQLDTIPSNYNELDYVEEGEITVTVTEGVLQLWQLTNGVLQEIPSNIVPDGEIGKVELSADGQFLAIGEDWGLRVWVWRLHDQALLYTLDTTPLDVVMVGKSSFSKLAYRSGPGQRYINDLAFSPDGKTLAVTNGFFELTMWDISSGELQRRTEDAGLEVAFASDGSRLATWQYTLSQWQTSSGSLINTLNQHIGNVTSLAFMPDGINLAIGSWDGSIYLRRITDGALYMNLRGHDRGITSIAVSADGNMLISGAADHTIRFWNLAENTSLLRGATGGYEMENITISADGQYVISAVADGGLHLWRIRDGELLEWAFGFGGMAVQPVEFSPTEMLFATLEDEDHLGLWRSTDVFSEPELLSGPAELWSRDIAFSANGELLAADALDGQIWLWQVDNGELLLSLEDPFLSSDIIDAIVFSPDSRLLAAVSGHKVLLWDVTDGAFLHELNIEYGWPQDVTFSPDGRILAIGSTDGTVRLWGIP